jgi:hypothetical protein
MPVKAATRMGAKGLNLSAGNPAITGNRIEPIDSPIAIGIPTAVPEIRGGTDSAGRVPRYIGYIPAPNRPHKKKKMLNSRTEVPMDSDVTMMPDTEHSRRQ